MPKATKPKAQKAVITITDSDKGITFGVVFTPTVKTQEPTTSTAVQLAMTCIGAVSAKIAEWKKQEAAED